MSYVSDLIANVKTTVKNTGDTIFKKADTAVKDGVNNLFGGVEKTAAAVIENGVIKSVPRKPTVSPPPPSDPLPPAKAAGASQLPDYTVALAVAGVVALLILFRKA